MTSKTHDGGKYCVWLDTINSNYLLFPSEFLIFGKNQNGYISMNLLSFPITQVVQVILFEKQLIKHNVLLHCLNFYFRRRSQYKSFSRCGEVGPNTSHSVGVERFNGKLTGTSRQLTLKPWGLAGTLILCPAMVHRITETRLTCKGIAIFPDWSVEIHDIWYCHAATGKAINSFLYDIPI